MDAVGADPSLKQRKLTISLVVISPRSCPGIHGNRPPVHGCHGCCCPCVGQAMTHQCMGPLVDTVSAHAMQF